MIEELTRIRSEVGWPPLAAPIGQVIASQALLHVLAAERYQTRRRRAPRPPRGTLRHPARRDLTGRATRGRARLRRSGDAIRAAGPRRASGTRYQGIAASEEELLLVALFGDDAEPLLRTIRWRGRDDSVEGGGVDGTRAARIREIVRIVQESGVGEVTIEDAGLRVTVRRAGEPAETVLAATATGPSGTRRRQPPRRRPRRRDPGVIRVESPMVGTFYRAPSPGSPPFVQEGDPVGAGQTLCVLEAMKLMNEVKAELDGIVRRIHAENAQPVEYGQLLFELEPVAGRPTGL